MLIANKLKKEIKKTISLTRGIKNKINVNKEIRGRVSILLQTKILMKAIKEGTMDRKMACISNWKNTVIMSILPKSIYRLNEIPITKPMNNNLHRIRKKILQSVQNHKKITAKIILSKNHENTYRAMEHNRQPRNKQCISSQFIFDKSGTTGHLDCQFDWFQTPRTLVKDSPGCVW